MPYFTILEILDNSIFIAKKAKTYDEEKNVAIKAPVDGISISDLNVEAKNIEKMFMIYQHQKTPLLVLDWDWLYQILNQ